MEAILVAIGAVALAEMGDKTQLLAFLLASRFKKPTPIIPEILQKLGYLAEADL